MISLNQINLCVIRVMCQSTRGPNVDQIKQHLLNKQILKFQNTTKKTGINRTRRSTLGSDCMTK